MSPSSEVSFPTLVQDFFCQRLMAQRNASRQTVAAYRDSFRLLLRFAQQRIRKAPADLTLQDLDAPLVLDFLDHCEKRRSNTARTRNARLAAIRSFMNYAALRCPHHLPIAHRVRAIPMKRFDRPPLNFLSRQEVQAIIKAPDRATWSGRRDHVMFATFYNTGARVSEIIGLRVDDLSLDRDVSIQLHGKGRKLRAVPLWKETARHLRQWLPEIDASPQAPVFPNRLGKALSRSGIEHRLRAAVRKAVKLCPSLKRRTVSPHTIRHCTAMHLLQSGVDITVIALWLGHESPKTTHLYVEADLAMKRRALEKLNDPSGPAIPFRPGDALLNFLENL